ncbi:hypothetical protein J437_LFUL018879 [Ladona fulva]|uniref:Uncharacterized protein n=1 Tax=Ladona fulva TaxID=123851 RepID=A0A8K0PD49_LADFU|nr:hypothetical protein J437_LFUL018879 [Ladona fulva]
MRCKQLIYGGAKGQPSGIVQQTKKTDFGIQTTLGESSKSQAPEVHLLHKKIKQLENDKEFLKELCRRRHKQREDLKKELATLSGQSTSKAQPENKENVNLNA